MTPLEQIDILNLRKHLPTFELKLKETSGYPLLSTSIDILQLNVGKRCNLSCRHCHVEAGPNRTETMSKEIFEKAVEILQTTPISTVDITGGSPEMNPHLEWFIGEVCHHAKRIIVRTNLSILLEKPFEKFIDLYRFHRVEVVSSLPDYHPEKTDRMRGVGTFEKCIKVLKRLNDGGFGKENTGLILNLVHNPVGAFLPACQTSLELEYRDRLWKEHGVQFSHLLCLTNLPVGRYLQYLLRSGNIDAYLELLVESYNVSAVDKVMCKTTLSVGWDGQLYDCDFNQMLELPIQSGISSHIRDFDWGALSNRPIVVNNHCFGCTAGSGSSCQGSLTLTT